MKVEDLIKELRKLPKNNDVIFQIENDTLCYADIVSVKCGLFKSGYFREFSWKDFFKNKSLAVIRILIK